MSLILYPYSVDNAIITYNRTHDSGYGEERLLDRNKNDLFKDSSIEATSSIFDFDLGSGIDRVADSLIIGNYKLNDGGNTPILTLYDSANGSDFDTVIVDTLAEASSYSTVLKTGTLSDPAQRYWRLSIYNVSGNLTSLEIGNIFFGQAITISKGYELDTPESIGYYNQVSENLFGNRFSQLYNPDDPRRLWQFTFGYLSTTDKSNLETFAGIIGASLNDNFSHYPFWFSPDSGTTIYFARMRGALSFQQVAYQAYSCTLIFEQEI